MCQSDPSPTRSSSYIAKKQATVNGQTGTKLLPTKTPYPGRIIIGPCFLIFWSKFVWYDKTSGFKSKQQSRKDEPVCGNNNNNASVQVQRSNMMTVNRQTKTKHWGQSQNTRGQVLCVAVAIVIVILVGYFESIENVVWRPHTHTTRWVKNSQVKKKGEKEWKEER